MPNSNNTFDFWQNGKKINLTVHWYHLYSWVERGTVRVKCLAQQHNTNELARTWSSQMKNYGKEHNKAV